MRVQSGGSILKPRTVTTGCRPISRRPAALAEPAIRVIRRNPSSATTGTGAGSTRGNRTGPGLIALGITASGTSQAIPVVSQDGERGQLSSSRHHDLRSLTQWARHTQFFDAGPTTPSATRWRGRRRAAPRVAVDGDGQPSFGATGPGPSSTVDATAGGNEIASGAGSGGGSRRRRRPQRLCARHVSRDAWWGVARHTGGSDGARETKPDTSREGGDDRLG